MSIKVLRTGDSPEVPFPLQSVRRNPQHSGAKSCVIALLFFGSVVTFVGTMLVHYPQKVDAFLNSDEPVGSKHVVTRSH